MAGTVLLVHDEPALRKLLRLRLENEGVGVLEATNVERAVQLHAERAADVGAIVSGARLAGLGGRDLLGGLRSANPGVPVFFFTSLPFPDADPLPPNVSVFVKPHGLNALVRAVLETLPAVVEQGASD
jgi:CheY-like chemotaxis protein